MRRIICFHNPDEENGYLSNWYLSQFEADGRTFSSMEQYMMYEKAYVFRDMEIAEQIMGTDQVGKIKSLGRSVKNYEESVWSSARTRNFGNSFCRPETPFWRNVRCRTACGGSDGP